MVGYRLLLGHDLSLSGVLGSLAVGGGLFYFIFLLSEKYIGGGDIKLGFALGLLLADWRLAILMLFISSILGSLVGIPLLLAKAKQASSKIKLPFAPFLILAALTAYCVGQSLVDWYLNLM